LFVAQRIFLTLLPLFICVLATNAAAQGFRDAEIEFNRGELLLEMRDYPRAIFAFNKAFTILPDQRYLAGLARAYFGKGERENALVHGQRYLERAGDNPDPEVKELVAELRSEFTKDRGQVDVTLFPRGGKLIVVREDGTQETTAVTEKEVTRWLPLESVTLVYEKDGFERAQQKVQVDRAKVQSVRLELGHAAGESELVVDANIRYALVYVDGKEAGYTPFKKRVDAGDHIVQVWAEDHLAWTGVIDAPAARSVSVQAKLVPAAGRVGSVPIPQVLVEEQSNFWRLSTWGWITMGTGIAAGGAAGYFYYTFNQKWAEVEAAEGDLQNQLLAEATSYYNITMIAGITGGALIGGGLLMVLLDKGDELDNAATFELLSVAPTFTPDVVLLDAAFSF
jgi:tetratricopeptide (TPR) repeat protein